MSLKINFSRWKYFSVALILALAIYGGVFRGIDAMMALRNWFGQQMMATEVAKPVLQAGKPVAPVPLAVQIPRCRKRGSGYQACMFQAGYAVNAEWTSAHDKDTVATANATNFARAIDVVGDPYRAGPSPAYGVPYWAPRP